MATGIYMDMSYGHVESMVKEFVYYYIISDLLDDDEEQKQIGKKSFERSDEICKIVTDYIISNAEESDSIDDIQDMIMETIERHMY